MTPSRRTIRIWLIAGIVVCAAAIGVTRLTDAFQLGQVTYNGKASDNFGDRFGLNDSASIFDQPLDSLADAVLAMRNVFKVDVNVSLPRSVDICTNSFEPICYAVDKSSGLVYGLTQDARAIQLENAEHNWEHPMLTGVAITRLYDRCNDHRVVAVLKQLGDLEERNIDLYRMIEEIDFSSSQFIAVALAGIRCQARVHAESLANDIVRYADFVARYGADLTTITVIDLRYEDMIVTTPRRR